MAAQYIYEKSGKVTCAEEHTFPRYSFEIGLVSLQYARIIKLTREPVRDFAPPRAGGGERASLLAGRVASPGAIN